MALCVVCSTEIRDDARFCPSCGAEQPKTEVAGTDADPLMGKVVAKKFKVEKLLGVGGMGKVYKARQLSLDKAVVVKVLHDHFREDPQLVQRFQREAKAASRLNHPNSIQIIDFGQDDGGVVFMAMEFLQGQDLYAALKKDGPFSAQRLARVMTQVCSALAEAHEQNVIHRDLKPENIMVEDRRGQKDFVKVLDFGIAKIQDPGEGQQALTQAGMVCGTPEYMSPEQARGLLLDPRSDIYALGVVMYQLATGELPFTADTPIGIVTKHILEKPVAPSQKRKEVPPALEAIILKAMEKEADKRYATVSELGEALEGLAASLPASAGSGSGFAAQASTNPQAATAAEPPATGATGVSSPAVTAPTGGALARPPSVVVVETTQTATASMQSAPRRNNGMAMAAVAFVGVLAIGGGAVFALKDKFGGAPAVVDAGAPPAQVHDAGAPAVPPGAADAGVAKTGVAAVVDAGPSTVAETPHVEPDGGKVKEPGVSASRKAEAARKAKAAAARFNTEIGATPGARCSKDLTNALIAAADMDKGLADPFWYIAQCMVRDGVDGCKAVREYERRGAPANRVARLSAMACR